MKGIVYQIYNDNHPNIHYVGSTIRTLESRWQCHQSDFKNKKKRRPVICQYFDEFGIDNFQNRLIKEYEVVDIKHLIAYEQLWINKLKPINLVKNLFSIKKREHIKERKKIYWQNNREYFLEKKSSLYTCPCSPDNTLTVGCKARHERSLKHQKYLRTLEETKE